MPNTLIREGYLDSDLISSLSDFEDRVFFRILLAADDAGRTDGRMDKLRSALFPTREAVRSGDVEKVVGRLMDAGLLTRWLWDAKPIVQVLKWRRRSKSVFSKFPDSQGTFRIVWVRLESRDGVHEYPTTSIPTAWAPRVYPIGTGDDLNVLKPPKSLSESNSEARERPPPQLNPQPEGALHAAVVDGVIPQAVSLNAPTIEEIVTEGIRIMLPREECEKFLDHYAANGWERNGTPIKNWRPLLNSWWRKWRGGEFGAKNVTSKSKPATPADEWAAKPYTGG